MLKGFKQFVFRGNVLDLAVAVVIGAAFGAVVTALVKDLVTPLIAALVTKPDFSAIVFTINGSKFLIGEFINAVVSFLLVAAAIYFFVVAPVNALMARMARGEAPPTRLPRSARSVSATCPSRPSVARSAPASWPSDRVGRPHLRNQLPGAGVYSSIEGTGCWTFAG